MAGENSEMKLVCMRVCVRVCARARKCVSASVHIHHGLADVDTYKYIHRITSSSFRACSSDCSGIKDFDSTRSPM